LRSGGGEGEGGEAGRGGEGGTADIKSNNPHLTGGEKTSSLPGTVSEFGHSRHPHDWLAIWRHKNFSFTATRSMPSFWAQFPFLESIQRSCSEVAMLGMV